MRGVLKGYDPLLNIVLDDCNEALRDEEGNVTGKERKLGLVVCRATLVVMLSPTEGMEQIANPFLQPQE